MRAITAKDRYSYPGDSPGTFVVCVLVNLGLKRKTNKSVRHIKVETLFINVLELGVRRKKYLLLLKDGVLRSTDFSNSILRPLITIVRRISLVKDTVRVIVKQEVFYRLTFINYSTIFKRGLEVWDPFYLTRVRSVFGKLEFREFVFIQRFYGSPINLVGEGQSHDRETKPLPGLYKVRKTVTKEVNFC